MSKQPIYEFHTESAAATEELAEQLGRQLKGGEVIELIGDVGTGKTTFVRGLARGIGSKDRVSSPTFTVSKIYNSDLITLYHYDFYRLNDLNIIRNELAETTADSKNSVVLEWADEVRDALNPDHIRLQINVRGDEARQLTFYFPQKYRHIRIKQ